MAQRQKSVCLQNLRREIFLRILCICSVASLNHPFVDLVGNQARSNYLHCGFLELSAPPNLKGHCSHTSRQRSRHGDSQAADVSFAPLRSASSDDILPICRLYISCKNRIPNAPCTQYCPLDNREAAQVRHSIWYQYRTKLGRLWIIDRHFCGWPFLRLWFYVYHTVVFYCTTNQSCFPIFCNCRFSGCPSIVSSL